MAAAQPSPPEVVRYGADADQVANVHRPAGEWSVARRRAAPRRLLARPLRPDADDAARQRRRRLRLPGLERRVPARRARGGGWPGTLDDVGAALDALREVGRGGHRPASSRSGTPRAGTSPSGSPHRDGARAAAARPRARSLARRRLRPRPRRRAWARRGRGRGASSAARRRRWRSATRTPRRPRTCRSACRSCSSTAAVTRSSRRSSPAPTRRRRAPRATTSSSSRTPSADHVDVIDPGHPLWAAVLERLPALLP